MPTAQRRPVLDATTFEMSRIAEAYSRISFPSVRHDSVISSDTVGGGPKQFPVDYQLVVTTSRGVFAWDMLGVTELFKSGSGGIVAAKKLTGDNMSLAVADSQVVILHDVGRSIQKSYRLKSSEVLSQFATHTQFNPADQLRGKSDCSVMLANPLRTYFSPPLYKIQYKPSLLNTLDCSNHTIRILLLLQCSPFLAIRTSCYQPQHNPQPFICEV